MSKKVIIVAVIIVLVVAIALLISGRKKKEVTKSNTDTEIKVTDIKHDEETGLYYIKDEETGEIIHASYDKDDPELDFYRDHPDYNPNPLQPRSTDLNDFVKYER